MTKKLQKEFIHCMTKSKMNQNSNHISIFTKLMLIVKKKKSRRRRAWKNMSKNKFSNNWREFVALSSFNCVAQIEAYVLKIQQCVLHSIKIFISWTNFFFEIKFFWNEKCVKAITTAKRRRIEWIALHIKKIWRNYLKTLNEKKRIIAKKKNRV
jgi:thiamine biosynthesis protein ThiC